MNTLKMFTNFLKLNLIAAVSRLSIETLFILLAQETAKLPKVKVGGLKKILPLGPSRPQSGGDFFLTSNFDLG